MAECKHSNEELLELFDNVHDGCPFEHKEDRMLAAIQAIYDLGQQTGSKREQARWHDMRRCYARQIFTAAVGQAIGSALDASYSKRECRIPSQEALRNIVDDAWRAFDTFEQMSDERQASK